MASLTISFGLVAVPVKLYTAHQSTGDAISFNLLHKACGSRLKQQYVCQKEGVVVERDDMVKGFEFAKDQYVHFTPEEIKALEEAGTHSLDIQQFVPIDAVDPVYFDRTYYLSPDKGGQTCALGDWVAPALGQRREAIPSSRPATMNAKTSFVSGSC